MPGRGIVVAFPSEHTSVVRDVAQLDGNLRELAAAVHGSFLATFATIPESLLAAAAELVADRRREELATHWRATLRLYVESLEAGLIVVGIIANVHDLQQLGRRMAESIHRISTLVLGEFITASHGGDTDTEMLSVFDELSAETGHFAELLAELRRKTDCTRQHAQTHETNSAP